MKRGVVIAGFRKETMRVLGGQLVSLFGYDLDVYFFVPEEKPIKSQIFSKEDIFLLSGHSAYQELKTQLPFGEHVIYAELALQTEGIRALEQLSEGRDILFVAERLDIARSLLKAVLYTGQMNFSAEVADLSNPSAFQHRKVIVGGIPFDELPSAECVIDLKVPMLDLVTILEIGVRLGREEILPQKNISDNFLRFVPIHKGVLWSLEDSNSFNSSIKILLNLIDGAVISIGQNGRIQDCNRQVDAILQMKSREIIGKRADLIFPQIPFSDVIQGNLGATESLKVINDEHMVVTVKPIFNSGKRYGAIAIVKRFDDEENRQHKLRRQVSGSGYHAKYSFDDIIGDSVALTRCKGAAERMASSASPVMIQGETGVGKELFAHAIHQASSRKAFQFIAVNCGAIPESLLESELFGYEEGAFTGAKKGGKLGFFELAHRGTLFLDEISEMPLMLQKRLLRVLQEKEFLKVGGSSVIHVDVRIIAASNRDLRFLAESGEFRWDLYYRLHVLPLRIPPLRERKEDIHSLISYFVKDLGGLFEMTEVAHRELERYQWPGNVREIRNLVEYFINLSQPVIGMKELMEIIPLSDPVQKPLVLKKEPKVSPDNELDHHHLLVLHLLKDSMERGQKMGRRTISALAMQKGILLGEQEVRRILVELQEFGLVEIRRTKGGTVITPKGAAVISGE